MTTPEALEVAERLYPRLAGLGGSGWPSAAMFIDVMAPALDAFAAREREMGEFREYALRQRIAALETPPTFTTSGGTHTPPDAGVLAEREACAQLAESFYEGPSAGVDTGVMWRSAAAHTIAVAIRQRPPVGPVLTQEREGLEIGSLRAERDRPLEDVASTTKEKRR